MKPEKIEKLLMKDPFVPFRIRMADGGKRVIKDPGLVWISPTWLRVFTPVKKGSRIMKRDDRYLVDEVIKAEPVKLRHKLPARRASRATA